MQRRQFLAAAAALASLQTATGHSEAETLVEDQTVTDDGTYSVTDCGAVPGNLSSIQLTAEMADGPLDVTGIYEETGWSGVELRWTAGPLEASTRLSPADARQLARRLQTAAAAAEDTHDD